ncbi:MAG TPA: phosphotransferase family protein [Acidimicrobiales bacterium]|nr:phosphotransferase family protein [Acidimicrobiales bacterium]
MATTTMQDDDALTAGLTRWLAQRHNGSGVTLTGLHRPSAGYSSETVMVDAAWSADGVEHHRSLVIRMAPPSVGTFQHYDLRSQWSAQVAAAAVGVPVADPVVESDTGWLGAPFMVMPRVDGHIIGSLAHRDRWLLQHDDADHGRVYANFIGTLATIHSADITGLVEVPRRDNSAELDFWERYLQWSSDGCPVPVLADGLRWCREHRPVIESEPVLLWGDARFENMVLGDDLHPRAVLDWDMTSVGAPEHDLAWFTSLDLTMERIFGERLAGFPDRAATINLFEQRTGRPVRDLDWYETLAMVRSTAIMTRISYLRRAAGQPLLMPIEDNPLLDLVRDRLG